MPKRVKVEIFNALRKSLEDARAFEQGARTNLRVTRRDANDHAKRDSSAHGG
jgi:hypothetical protein